MEITQEQRKQNDRKLLFILFLFISIFGGCYYMMSSGADCIRMIPDGSVRCNCDFPNTNAWEKFRDDTKGAWEAVALAKDPCK